MIVKGINDDPEELRQMADLVRNLRLDRIHLNTVARPPAEDFALAVTADEMHDIVDMFDSRVEVIVDFDRLVVHEVHGEDMENQVLSLLRRRPCTLDDVSNSLGIHRNEVVKYVNHLTRNGSVRRVKHSDKWYYEQTSAVIDSDYEKAKNLLD